MRQQKVAVRLDGRHKAADEPGRSPKHPGCPAHYVRQTEAGGGEVSRQAASSQWLLYFAVAICCARGPKGSACAATANNCGCAMPAPCRMVVWSARSFSAIPATAMASGGMASGGASSSQLSMPCITHRNPRAANGLTSARTSTPSAAHEHGGGRRHQKPARPRGQSAFSARRRPTRPCSSVRWPQAASKLGHRVRRRTPRRCWRTLDACPYLCPSGWPGNPGGSLQRFKLGRGAGFEDRRTGPGSRPVNSPVPSTESRGLTAMLEASAPALPMPLGVSRRVASVLRTRRTGRKR